MGEWLIYGSNGTQKATVKKLEYSGEFMGETSVTCDIYSPSPISFSIGDYLVYRGERFTIDYDATRLKQARNDTYGKGYTYENMRFLSYVGELKKCEFLDFVPSDNLIHFSQLPDFSFYAETVNDLADRLQANLDRIYTGSNAWSVQVVQGFEGKENINVSVSKATCFDALRMAYDQFEATFIIRGRTITIGTAGNELETDFKYGKGNGLKTIERSVDESDSLVTRLRAYGNTTNLPANYYKNIGMRVYAPIYEIYHVSATGCDIHFVPKLKNACFSDKNGQYNYWVTVSLDETLWLKAVASPNNHLSSTAYSVVSVGLYGSNTQAQVTQFLNQLQSGTYDKLYFKEGINVGAWPVEYREYAENVPNLMAIDRLMLPGFPELTTDPYIDASNISTLGVREKSVYFDGSDPDTPDIHPTLEGMTAAELRAAGYTIDLDAGDNGNLDEIAADATETDGSPITADGAFEGVDEVPGFKVSIKDIGFDINDYLSTETATLVMKTGMCGGREFTIVKVEKVGNKYVLECQRTEDVSHYFPYNPYLIKAGDKFVLTNIEMPKAYIDAASQRLLAAAQAYIAKYSAPQWVYAIKMDDIWMQRQRDNSASEASSYYWNIKEGDVMNVTDSDLGVDIAEVIDRLTIREGFGPIPEFEVVLRKEKPQGTIGVLQNRIRLLELRNAEQVDIIRRQQNYLTFIFGDTLADVMSQLDKKAETWYQANDPSSAWTNDEDKAEHVGDLWMDTSANGGKKTYIYQNTGTSDSPNYQWVEQYVPDEVFDEIDGKAEIFVQKPASYHERDMWIIENGISSSDLPAGCVAGDIVISSTDSTSFNKAHWSKKDRYTDDSSLNNFISGTYAQNLQDIQDQVDGKAETWYQSTDPSTAWTTTALKNQHKGDIWHNSSNTTINGVKAGQDAIWNGTAWVVDETVPQSVYDTIDGKAAIYVAWGAWGNDLQVKDLFIPSANTTQGGVTYKANKVYRCTNKTTPTFQEIAYTDDAALNAFLNGYTGTLTGIRGDITTAQTTADNAATAASNANTAAAAAQATADALDYLKQAYLADNTLIDHGLILSTIVALRDSSNNVWSGISGAYDSTKLGNGIAAWYGGGMIDKEVSAVSNAAKSLFRFDGSGYVASGNLKWDANGNVTIQGYSINATTLQVGGSNVATESSISTFFANFFDIYNGSTQITYEQYVALQDKSNVSLKAKHGLWTEQFLSALGMNSQGGGGSGAGLEDVWDSLTNQQGTVITDNTKIAIAHIPDTSSTYGYLKSSALNGYATQNWVNQQGFLTTHQTLYTLSIYGGTTKVLDFKPNANASIYIKAGGDISLTNDTTNKYITLSYTHPTNGANTTISAASGKVLSAITVNNLGHVTSVSSKTLAAADIPDISATYATAARATTLEGYFNSGGVAKEAAKLSTVSKKAWGQTYWTSGGVPQDVDGTLTISGGELMIWNTADTSAENRWDMRFMCLGDVFQMWAYEGAYHDLAIGNTAAATATYKGLYYDASEKRWGIGTTTPSYTLDVQGNIGATSAITLAGTSASTRRIYFGDTSHYIELTSTGFHFSHGIYSDSFVSALGSNSSGGGGGTFDEEAMWTALGTTSTAKVIASSHIPNLAASKITSGTLADARIPSLAASKITSGTFAAARIPIATASAVGGIKVGTTLAISDGVLNQKSGIATAGTYKSVTVDTYGRVTAGTNPTTLSGYGITNAYTKTQVDTALSGYLPLSGGTLTGGLGVGGVLYTNGFAHMIKFDVDTSRALGYAWWDTNSNTVASIVYHNTAQNIILNPIGSANTYSDAVGKYSLVIGNNKLTYNTYPILHSNNFDNYALPLTGGTLTSFLDIDRSPYGAVSLGAQLNVLRARCMNAGTGTFAYNSVISLFGSGETETTVNNLGVRLGSTSGATWISAGESGKTLSSQYTAMCNTENVYITADGSINFFTGCSNDGTSYTWAANLDSSGNMSLINSFYMKNAKSILFEDTDGTSRSVLNFSSNNNVNLGYGTATLGTGTYIYGKTIVFRTNSTSADAAIIDDSKNLTVKGYVAVGTGGANSALKSNAANNIYLENSEGIPLVCAGLVVRRGASATTATLGNSDYPWGGLYSTTGDFSSTLSVTGASTLTGNITTAGHIYLNNNRYIYGKNSDDTNESLFGINTSNQFLIGYGHRTSGQTILYGLSLSLSTNGSTRVTITNAGNVGVANTSPSQKLHVTGNILASGEVTASSDERLKTIVGDGNLDIRYIANAPNILFKWNNGQDDKVHGGSLAQYFLHGAKHFVLGSDKDYYSLNYGALATSMAISIAKEVLKHEDEITRLKKEVVKLRERVAELEERRIA